MASTIERFVGGVSDALGDIARAMTSEAGFHEVATALGWDLTVVPAPFAHVAAPAQALLAMRDELEATPSPAAIERASTAIADLVAALRALDAADFGAGFDELEQFGREAIDHSIIEYLFREHRLVLHILRVMGIVRMRFVGEAGARGPYVRREILWANIPRVLTDPSAAYREAYGWGTPDLDGLAVLEALQDLLCSMRWPAGLEQLDPKLVDALASRGPGEHGRNDVAVTVNFFSRAEPGREVTAGLRILELPGTAARLPAFAVMPFAAAEIGTRFAIDEHVDGELVADAELQGGIALRLSPEDGLSLLTGLDDPDTASAATGTITAAIDVHDPAKQAKTFIATDAFRFSARTVMGRAGATVSTGDRDLFAEIELKDARIELGGSEDDGLVRHAVPAGSGADFSLAIGISTKRGVYFRGGGGLSTRIPIGRGIGPARLDAIRVTAGPRGAALELKLESEISLRVGPVTLTLDGLGGAATFTGGNGNLGIADVAFDALMPSGLGIAIESELVSGGGAIARDELGYLGGFAVRVGNVGVTATGLVQTKNVGGADYSFAALLSATFPRIQLFAGFTLDGIGGAVMLHRTIDVDALRARLRTGFGELLFPSPSTIATAARSLRELFPAREGRYVIGPAARIGWGTPAMLRADLALLLELPAPVRIVLLGSVEVGFPTLEQRVVDLRIDLLGVLDFAKRTLAFDASLHDSKIAGYELTGDVALRMGWGDDPHFLLSIGGFHPRFQPPAGFPALRRIALTIGDNPQLRLEAYVALTSSTLQLGAHVDLSYKASGLRITGYLHFDALIQVRPLAIDTELSAGVSISYRGHNIASAKLEFVLTGPRPWRAHGSATIGILWWDVSVSFDVTWGDGTQPALPPPPDVAALVHDAFAAHGAWAGELRPGERPWLVLRDRDAGDDVRIHPLAVLVVRQHAAPLAYPITRFANTPLETAVVIEIETIGVGTATFEPTPVQDVFAPGQFTQLARDEELTAPSFEKFVSGARFGDDAVTLGNVARASMEHVTIVDDPLAPPARTPPKSAISAELLAAVTAMRATPAARAPAIRLAEPRYVLASIDTLAITPVAATVAAGRSSFAALREAARSHASLQVVPVTEAAD